MHRTNLTVRFRVYYIIVKVFDVNNNYMHKGQTRLAHTLNVRKKSPLDKVNG